MAEPLGRPKTLVRRHVLEIKEDTRDWLEEQMNGLKLTFIAGKATRSVGEVLKGAVSHPIGLAIVSAAITAWLVAQFGPKGVDGDEVYDLVKQQLKKGGVDVPDAFFSTWEAVYDVSRTMFPFLPLFPTVGAPPPEEKPPDEPFAITECQRLNREWQIAKRGGRTEDAETLRQEAMGRGCLWATTTGR